MVAEQKREYLYGECREGSLATRMIHEGRYKLIYYGCGNRTQLFDLEEDPNECRDLSESVSHTEIRDRLTDILIGELYGSDEEWVQDGKLAGIPDQEYSPRPNRSLSGQRGSHWPGLQKPRK